MNKITRFARIGFKTPQFFGKTSYATNSGYDFHSTVSIPGVGSNFHNIWLRHHCLCEKCLNLATFQRAVIPSYLPGLSVISDLARDKDNTVRITWSDGHVSVFKVEWLAKARSNMERSSRSARPFPGPEVSYKDYQGWILSDPLANGVDYRDFMGGDEGVAKLLENIVQTGVGIVVNSPPDYNSTKEVILRVARPANTLFGDFSEWSSDLSQADSAYTAEHVHLHTDTTYFTEPMGLQIFHCLKHDGTGGRNSLVDGWAVAGNLDPGIYDGLSKALVPCHYYDPGKHDFFAVDTTLKHDKVTGRIQRIRYNPHDIATLDGIPWEELPKFYEGLVALSDALEKSPTWLKLSPGTIIFLDNWRILHGRESFTGYRHLCGAYISRSDWTSRARVLGVKLS